MFVTIVEAEVEAERENDLLAAWSARTTTLPEGLIESSLLRGEHGAWRIVTVWESKDAVLAMRASGQPPAALEMFEEAGARPFASMWTVQGRVTAERG